MKNHLTLFLPAKGRISPYMRVTWPSPLGIGLTSLFFDMYNEFVHTILILATGLCVPLSTTLSAKGLEALRKKILLNHGVGTENVNMEECKNLINGDMAEFQKPKNAQMLPYDEERWEIAFEKLRLAETLGDLSCGV